MASRTALFSSTAAAPADDVDTVSISRAEYHALAELAHKYTNLCQNLIHGGVEEQTVQLLSSHTSAAPASSTQDVAPIVSQLARKPAGLAGRQAAGPRNTGTLFLRDSAPPAASDFGHCHGYHNGEDSVQQGWEDDSQLSDNVPDPSDLATDVTPAANTGETWQAPPPSRFEREATRSIQLLNLPDATTHADITSVVRGGLLLDLYLRYKENSAVISFLHGVDAQAFYQHVRLNGLYIKKQRVDIRWNKCQFTLAGHTAHKIGLGATRNLVIRHRNPNLTERHIRDDLEHIHNLAVIKVEFIGDKCYISTNSVHNAVFARLCMMSRREYKGSRIEWGIDECAQSLDRMAGSKHCTSAPSPAKSRPMNPMANRFELLKLDD